MDLNEIVVFAKVVETKSFTAAAQALGLPKSTVSRKVSQLEERLDARLLQRTTRKLSLTEIGRAYYERCQRIVADIAAAEQLVDDLQATPRGRLKVTAPVDLGAFRLGELTARFLTTNADIDVHLELTDRVIDLVDEGFDLAIRFGPLPESTLIAKKLGSLQSVLCAAPEYLAKRKAPTNVEELEDLDKVLFTPSARTQSWTLTNGDQTYELARPAKFSSNNIMAVHAAVLAGLGISVMTEFVVACDLHEGRLVRILPEWSGVPVDIHAVYPARQNLPPRLSLFLDHLARSMSPPPWDMSRHPCH